MKTLKSIALLIVFTLGTAFSGFANSELPLKTKRALRTQIVDLLGKNIPVEVQKQKTTATVSFMINSKNELVVLDVDSDHQNLSSFVKAKLNYKKVAVKGIQKGSTYILPLKVNKP